MRCCFHCLEAPAKWNTTDNPCVNEQVSDDLRSIGLASIGWVDGMRGHNVRRERTNEFMRFFLQIYLHQATIALTYTITEDQMYNFKTQKNKSSAYQTSQFEPKKKNDKKVVYNSVGSSTFGGRLLLQRK